MRVKCFKDNKEKTMSDYVEELLCFEDYEDEVDDAVEM